MSSPRKYRGKPVDGGEMVQGFLAAPDQIMTWDEERAVGDMVQVIPETVGQYTGLEMNDIEIWGGDIFRGKESGTIYWVVFREGEYILVNNSKSPPIQAWKHCCLHYAIHNLAIEIIGNIHDKPELLKEQT